MARFGKPPSQSRLRKLARKIDPPKPPPPPVFVAFMKDGDRIERLSPLEPDPLPEDARQLLFEIVDPEPVLESPELPAEPERELESALPTEVELMPDPPKPKAKRKRETADEKRRRIAREDFKRRTGDWAAATGRTSPGVDFPRSKRRAPDPDGVRNAVRQGRMRVAPLGHFRPTRGR